MPAQQIAYLWVPHFGATVARQVDPTLDGRPLALIDDQGRVLAVDASAARAGVAAGMAERTAALRCPPAALLPAARYPIWEAQEAFWARTKRYAERWQPDGLGCVYLDITRMNGDLLGWCQSAAQAVRDLGWQPALGMTGSKFGASVAGQVPGGAVLLMKSVTQRDFLASQPVGALPLDADALTQLGHLGIRTLGQFAHLPPAGVLTRFGTPGRTAQRWAQGLDDRPVVPPWEAPEVSARIEFDAPLADRERLLAILERQAEKLLAPLRERFQVISRVALSVTRADGRVVPAGYTFALPAAAPGPIRFALATALDRVVWDGQPAGEITLTLAGITDLPGRQLTLFDLNPDNQARLQATLDQLAARFGPDAFRFASLTDPDNPLPERRISWWTYNK